MKKAKQKARSRILLTKLARHDQERKEHVKNLVDTMKFIDSLSK
jgi:hypothetical protein